MKRQLVDLSRKDILIVDDAPDNLRVLTSLLAKRGFYVRKALNGAVALQACQKQLPDLVLLDIMMPGMDGYQVCQRLKADPVTCQIPVIFMSALDSVFDKVKAFQVGGADYITKPFQVEEVNARIAYQLTIQQQQRQLASQYAQLQQLNEELKRSNLDLEQFAYLASHDLRSPLQTITLLAEIAKEKYQDDSGTDCITYMDRIVDASMRMKLMIDNLLAYSSVSFCSVTFQLTNCETSLKEALANLQEQIITSAASITYTVLPNIQADPTQLAQLFQNLISNAIKFRRPNIRPEIEILADPLNREEWLIQVRDNGIGIERQNFERLFEMFQRLNASQDYPGSGIGMAISKKIVERHGGRIWVESEVGVGTTFYFTLPSA